VRHLDRPLNDGGTLLVTGALAGGVAGATSAALVLLRWNGGLRDFPMEPVGIGGGIGALLGATLFPVALRFVIPAVPLWRAATGSAVGTVAGGTFAMLGGGGLMGAVCGGGLGFVGAVLVLRLASDRASSVDAG
jgi:hypothetical protein